MHRLFFSLLLLGCAAPSLHATNYHVSTTGNDANAGTSTAAPWKTLAKIAAYSASPGFQPGDQILLKAGETFENFGSVVFSGSGAAGSPIVFDRYGAGAKPNVITGQKVLSGWAATSGGVFKWQSLSSDAAHLWEDGVYQRKASDATCADGAWFHDATTREVFWKPSSGTPTAHVVRTTQNGGTGLSFVDRSHITVRNLAFPGTSTPLSFRAFTGNVSGITVEDCDFQWNVTAINLHYPDRRLEDVVLRGNTITNVLFATKFWCDGTAALSGRMVNVLIENNTIRDLDVDGRFDPAGTQDHEAIYIQSPIGLVIRGNTVENVRPGVNGGNGISIWVPSLQGGFDNILVEHNFLNNTDTGIGAFGGSTPDRVSNAVIRHNVSCNNRRGFNLNTRCTSPGALKVMHNTAHNCLTGITLEFQSGWEVRHNIFSDTTTHIAFKSAVTNGALFPINNNLYHATGSDAWTSTAPSANWNATTWRALHDVSGGLIDSTSIFTDPEFINASGQFDQHADFELPRRYHHWLMQHELPADASTTGAPAAKPANDDLPNLVKYALGLSPHEAGLHDRITPALSAQPGGTYFTCAYTMPAQAAPDITTTMEASSDLLAWNTTGLTTLSDTSDGTTRTVTVRDSAPVSIQPRRFMRLSVTKP